MKLSVIIVSYNVASFLEQCLYSVRAASKDIITEIFVVDNASVDGSVQMVKEKFPEVNCIANKDNVGFSKANNQAIKISKGEYVLLLNPDTVVETDTFKKVIDFMDSHNDAGGLGVKMVDGKGVFLPESKRGLPTPKVSFYKMTGLSKLFPKSTIFNQYHLGFLDKDQIHSVEILSGAFMLLRKSVLDKIGLLDETFFMYGEDIDLSYRIIKSGYKNYYFPDTRIIHYKGESTKKGSLNYVYVFYNAMDIFVHKHFKNRYLGIFSGLIKVAIWLRAGIAMLKRIISKIFLPLLDLILIFATILSIVKIKESFLYGQQGHYPNELYTIVLPIMIFVWLVSLFLSGSYSKPVKLLKVFKGAFAGSVVLLAIYALLPETLRFSRSIVLLSGIVVPIVVMLSRVLLSFSGKESFSIKPATKPIIAVIGKPDEVHRVTNVLKAELSNSEKILGVTSEENGQIPDNFVGNINQLEDIIRVHKINELVFCSKHLKPEKIIDQMSLLQHLNINYKIAPPESLFIVGTNSLNNSGRLYNLEINSISKPHNKVIKSIFDIIVSLLLILTFPIHLLFIPNRKQFFKNIFNVLFFKYSIVGCHPLTQKSKSIIKEGILYPTDNFKKQIANSELIERLNMIYIKDYSLINDILILINGYKKLGRKPLK